MTGRSKNALGYTVRALLSRPHAGVLADAGLPLFAAAPAYGYELESVRGGLNSWRIHTPNGIRYLHGNLGHRAIEVRERAHGPAKLWLRTGKESEQWLRNGCRL